MRARRSAFTYAGWRAYRDRTVLAEVATPGALKGITFRGDGIVPSTRLRGSRLGRQLDMHVEFQFIFEGSRLIEQRSVPTDDEAWSTFWA